MDFASPQPPDGTSLPQVVVGQRQRDRPDALRGLNPQSTPAYQLIVETEPQTLDEALEEIANYTLKLDRLCFNFMEVIIEKIVSGRLTSDSRSVADAPTDLMNLQALKTQSIDILRGQRQLRHDYLSQSFPLKYWSMMVSISNQFLGLPDDEENRALRNWVLHAVSALERDAKSLPHLISSALAKGSLDADSRRVIRERWHFIDLVMETRMTLANVASNLADWSSISEASRQAPESSATRTGSDSWPSIVIWLFFTVMIISIPTCALGLRYSNHEPGSFKDSDFWFLIQNCCMGFLSLAIMSIPLIREKLLTKYFWLQVWTYGYLTIGFSSTIVAPVIYLYAPAEWSSFLTVLSSAIQVLVTWQVAMLAAGKEKQA